MAIIGSNCGLSKSILKANACKYTLNKVVDIYFANASDVKTVASSASTGGCGETVTSITLEDSAKWYEVQPSTDSASYSDALQVADRDIRYRTHTLAFSIGGEYDGEGVCTVNGLSLGEFIAVAVLASGNAILLGTQNSGLKASSVENTGSATATEFSGISVEMSADVTSAALPLSSEALTAIKGNVAE